MKELEIHAKNHLLVEKRRELGVGVYKCGEIIGIGGSLYSSYECLDASPVGYPRSLNTAHWKFTALEIANFFNCTPEELWPDAVLDASTRGVVVRMSANDMDSVIGHFTKKAVLPPDEILMNHEKERDVNLCLKFFSPREQEILKKRFGFDGDGGKTLQEVGQVYGVTKERIRQIEGKALRKLRHSSRSKWLRKHLPDDSGSWSAGISTLDDFEIVYETNFASEGL